jgi:hypothetical protein
MKFSAILIAALPLVSAWRIQFYDGYSYEGTELEDRQGTLSQPCKTFSASKKNKASSMKWDADGLGADEKRLRAYDGDGCTGDKLIDSEGNWNVPRFEAANNRVNSYKID